MSLTFTLLSEKRPIPDAWVFFAIPETSWNSTQRGGSALCWPYSGAVELG